MPADERADQQEKGLMKVCAALMADPKSAKSVNPSKGSFDNPTPAAMPLTRLAAIPRDA